MSIGILEVKFKDGITEDEIMGIISEFYRQNNKFINGMQYTEFEDPDTLHKIHTFFTSLQNSKEIVVGG